MGLVWSGSPTHRKDGDRSCSFAAFQTWFDLPNIQFYSLQTPVRPEEQAALAAEERIIDLAPQIRDFWDTAALIAELDLVISVDTAVIHLAGGPREGGLGVAGEGSRLALGVGGRSQSLVSQCPYLPSVSAGRMARYPSGRAGTAMAMGTLNAAR